MLASEKIIDRMVKACGAANQAEMLKFCDFSNAAASTWKKRGGVPDGSIALVAVKTGVRFEWLKTGEGPMREPDTFESFSHLVDTRILAKAIVSTEMILQESKITLTPDKKAMFIATLYEMAMEQGESSLDRTNVKRMLRLVG